MEWVWGWELGTRRGRFLLQQLRKSKLAGILKLQRQKPCCMGSRLHAWAYTSDCREWLKGLNLKAPEGLNLSHRTGFGLRWYSNLSIQIAIAFFCSWSFLSREGKNLAHALAHFPFPLDLVESLYIEKASPADALLSYDWSEVECLIDWPCFHSSYQLDKSSHSFLTLSKHFFSKKCIIFTRPTSSAPSLIARHVDTPSAISEIIIMRSYHVSRQE